MLKLIPYTRGQDSKRRHSRQASSVLVELWITVMTGLNLVYPDHIRQHYLQSDKV